MKIKRKQLIIIGILKIIAVDIFMRRIYSNFRHLVKIVRENERMLKMVTLLKEN